MAKAQLTAKQRTALLKSVYQHIADVLDSDWGDPFKHRDISDALNLKTPETDADEREHEQLYDAADEYFFVCVKEIAKAMRKGIPPRGKP